MFGEPLLLRKTTLSAVFNVQVDSGMSRGSDPESMTPTTCAGVKNEQIHEQMERVLNSSLFRSSHRCQALLRHVGERTLAGETANLKERSLGVDVFGRAPDYDTNADPVVRATAGEIRKKLAQYYQGSDHAGEIRIELNRGGYIPEFHAPPADPPLESRRKRPVTTLAAAAVAVMLAGGALMLLGLSKQQPLARFWAPMLDAPGSVLFCLAQPKVYNFRSDAVQKQFEAMIQEMSPAQFASSEQEIRLGQLVPMWDRYLAVGDVNCLLKLASMLERHGKPYRVRSDAATSLSDLREQPSILIGAFDNEWALHASREMRFTFYKDLQGLEMIRDRDHPDKTEWKLTTSWPHRNITDDYAIVSRVFDVHADRIVVIAAGITHVGTAGAGDFLSNSQYFAEATQRLPRDWQHRNLQIVLRVPVLRGVAGRPQVLATQVW